MVKSIFCFNSKRKWLCDYWILQSFVFSIYLFLFYSWWRILKTHSRNIILQGFFFLKNKKSNIQSLSYSSSSTVNWLVLKYTDTSELDLCHSYVRKSSCTASLRSCEYSKKSWRIIDKIHYITWFYTKITWIKKYFFSIKQDQRYCNPKAHIG